MSFTLSLRDIAFLRQSGVTCSLAITNGGGDSFDCYEVQDPIVDVLEAGNVWSGAWSVELNYFGLTVMDTFEEYPVGIIIP